MENKYTADRIISREFLENIDIKRNELYNISIQDMIRGIYNMIYKENEDKPILDKVIKFKTVVYDENYIHDLKQKIIDSYTQNKLDYQELNEEFKYIMMKTNGGQNVYIKTICKIEENV